MSTDATRVSQVLRDALSRYATVGTDEAIRKQLLATIPDCICIQDFLNLAFREVDPFEDLPQTAFELAAKRGGQTVHVAKLNDSLLKLPTAAAVMGLSVSSVQRLITAGELTPIKRGLRCTRLRSADVIAWVKKQGRPQ